MLLPFFYTLRALKIPVGTQEWLYLMDALMQDLAESSLTRFYYLARSLLIKSEALYDSFDQAFIFCFKNQSETFDIKKEILDWLNKTAERPELPSHLEKLNLDELRKRFLERLKDQMEEHHGGNKWIGTGGTSPFGHSGAHPSGIRIGGPGGGRMAVKIAEERRFANYRQDRILDTRQMKVALKKLRAFDRTGVPEELDMEKTIEKTSKNAGEIEMVFSPIRKNQTELLLLMDVGGSMDVFAHLAETLFSAAHASSHFKAFHHFYFHNCIYKKIYTDMNRRESISIQDLFRKFRSTFYVLIVGDACMNPYELFVQNGNIDHWEDRDDPGIEWLKRIKDHFPRTAWLNPENPSYWQSHPTIHAISKIFRMYPLSVKGLSDSVRDLKKGAA